MPQSLSRLHRAYIQNETTFGIAPNSGGTATVGNANGVAFTRFDLFPDITMLRRPDKSGSRSRRPGRPSRRIGAWDYEGSATTNGVGGVKSDQDPILQSAFSNAGTITTGTANVTAATNATPIVITAAGHGLANFAACFIEGVGGNTNANGPCIVNNVTANTFEIIGSSGNGSYTSGGVVHKASVKYSLADAPLQSFSVYHFRTPDTLARHLAMGCVTQTLRLQLNQDISTLTASGPAKFVTNHRYWPSADADMKAGLTTFPNEPSAQVLNGDFIEGFTGQFCLGSYKYDKLRSASVTFNTNQDLPRDYHGTFYPTAPEADERDVTIDFTLDDEDTAAIDQLYDVALSGAPLTAILGTGYRRGNCIFAVCQGVQLPMNRLTDGNRNFQRVVTGATASGSSLTARDEITIWHF